MLWSTNHNQVSGRTIRVDHVDEYRVPKIDDDTDEAIKQIYMEGCAPKALMVREPQYDSADEAEQRRKRLKLGTDGLMKLDESGFYDCTTKLCIPSTDDVEVKQIKKARKAARKAERLARREERQKRKVGIMATLYFLQKRPSPWFVHCRLLQLERRAAREELAERGTIHDDRWRQRGLEDQLGDMKPIQATSSFFKESKPDVKDTKDGKAYTEFDDEDFKPEHLVKMNYFEKQMVAKRYMVGLDWVKWCLTLNPVARRARKNRKRRPIGVRRRLFAWSWIARKKRMLPRRWTVAVNSTRVIARTCRNDLIKSDASVDIFAADNDSSPCEYFDKYRISFNVLTKMNLWRTKIIIGI